MSEVNRDIGAIVLAAGLSTRMGKPKMLLPWAGKTVLESVLDALLQGGISRPVVVLGAARDQIVNLLKGYPVLTVFNPDYADGEMLHSLQVGLSILEPELGAAFIVLGDQPQIQSSTVELLIEEYWKNKKPLVIPSFRMRKGHPWLVGAELWDELLGLQKPSTLRDFVQKHAADIEYVNVDTQTILADLDTPEDYQNAKPD